VIFLASYTRYIKVGEFYKTQRFESQKDLIIGLIESLCNNPCRHEINRLILICHSGYSMTGEVLLQFVHSKEYRNLSETIPFIIEDVLPPLLANTEIFTEKDFPELFYKKYSSIEEGFGLYLNISKLIESIGKDKVITNSEFMSKWFNEILSKIPNVDIYKRSFDNPAIPEFGLEKIDDANKDAYLTLISGALNVTPIKSKDNWNIHNIIDCFKTVGAAPKSIEIFYNEVLKIFRGEIRKISLVCSEEYLSTNFIEDLNKEYREFDFCDGADGSITIDSYKKGLVILNAHKLGPSEFKKIHTVIYNEKSSEIFLIFVSSVPLQYLRDQSFRIILFPTYGHMQFILDRLIVYISRKIFDEPDVEIFAEMLHNDVVKKIFQWIPSLNKLIYELNLLKSFTRFVYRDFTHRDFWWTYLLYLKAKDWKYDDEKSQIVQILPAQPRLSEEGRLPTSDDAHDTDSGNNNPPIPIFFTHNKGEDKWEITYSESEEPIKVKYKNNLGIMYLAYLAKHCKSKKDAIRADELVKIVKEWGGKEIKERGKKEPEMLTDVDQIKDKTPEQLDAADIKSAIHASFVNRSKKLNILNTDRYETQNQKKLEELKLGKDYKKKPKSFPEKGFIEYFYYERQSKYVIEKIIDEDNEKLFPSNENKTNTP